MTPWRMEYDLAHRAVRPYSVILRESRALSDGIRVFAPMRADPSRRAVRTARSPRLRRAVHGLVVRASGPTDWLMYGIGRTEAVRRFVCALLLTVLRLAVHNVAAARVLMAASKSVATRVDRVAATVGSRLECWQRIGRRLVSCRGISDTV